MGDPRNALKESSLVKLTAGSAAIGGSHTIFKVSFVDQGVSKTGYFKKLDPDNHFPELLAKFSVATSVIKRLFLGERAADERLVMDDDGNIVGILSVALEGFEPFNYKSEGIPADPLHRERVVPSTKTLIKKNFIEILLGRVIFWDDDGHPHNLGLAGDIDYDMSWYPFTIYMKEPRPVVGVPCSMFNFSVEDWEDFPRVRIPIFHHAANNYPGEFSPNIPGVINPLLPKGFADPKQFQQLANSPEAKEQQLAAGLKFLLTYQPEMMRKHLEDAFGDMPLNYTSLTADLQKIYAEKFPELCNPLTNKDSFVNFMMKMYQNQYDNVYRVVVFYMGCERNLMREDGGVSGIPLPATHTALYQKPSFFRNVEEWIKVQNKRLESEKKAKYDELELRGRYHQVWRDACTKTWTDLLNSCNSLCRDLQALACHDTIIRPMEDKKLTSSVSSARQLIPPAPVFNLKDVDNKILLDKTNTYGDAFRQFLQFTEKLHKIIDTYYSRDCLDDQKNTKSLNQSNGPKERKVLSEEDNAICVRELNQLLIDEENIRESLGFNTTPAKEYSRIINNLRQLVIQINFRRHLMQTDEQMRIASMQIVPRDVLPIESPEVINQFVDSLFVWARSLSSSEFTAYFEEILKKYRAAPFGNRYREPEVRQYLEGSFKKNPTLTNEQRLAYILSSGKSDDGALNTEIIKFCAGLVILKHSNPSVSKAIRELTFTGEVVKKFTLAVVNFAKTDKQFVNLHNKEGVKLFYNSLFTWAEELPQSNFDGLIKAALIQYKNQKGISSWFRSTREDEVAKYLNPPDKAPRLPQDKILAYIFLRAESDDSDLCKIVFKKLLDTMRKHIGDSNQEAGYQLIKDYDSEKYPHVYLEIKEHCRIISHKPDVKPKPIAHPAIPAAASF